MQSTLQRSRQRTESQMSIKGSRLGRNTSMLCRSIHFAGRSIDDEIARNSISEMKHYSSIQKYSNGITSPNIQEDSYRNHTSIDPKRPIKRPSLNKKCYTTIYEQMDTMRNNIPENMNKLMTLKEKEKS